MVIFFFFSSRRRHTRYWRDWSSDVCSSDLSYPGQRDARHGRLHRAALLHAGADSFSQGSAPFRKGTVSRRAVGDAPPARRTHGCDPQEVSHQIYSSLQEIPWCALANLREPTKPRSEEHTSELQSRQYLVCRL